jgi:hypothetical protein
VIAFEMLAGRAPFAEPPVLARLDGRTPAAPVFDGIARRERESIARCLSFEPDTRPTAAELATAFSA